MDEADCARCLGGRGVSEGGEGGCLFEDSARLPRLRLRLPGSLKLFDDRTGQHHCRWGGGGGGWTGGVGEVWKPVICIQLFLSSRPAPHFLLLLLLYLCLFPLLLYAFGAVAARHL